jgi:SLOG in TRPM, prokaryote
MQVLSSLLSEFKLALPTGRVAQAVVVDDRAGLQDAIATLGLQGSRPVLVIVGGAGNLEPDDYARLENLFEESLAPLAEELGMVVVDGGTDVGVMQLMGRARAKLRATFPLVGVAPLEKARVPQNPNPKAKPLEPNHTHFILVPGSEWGDESPWIAGVATALSGKSPSVTILLNGGNASIVDVRASIADRRPVVVIAGTGRLADELATAIRHPEGMVRPELSPLIETGLRSVGFALFDLSKSTKQLQIGLKQHMLSHKSLALSKA